MLVQLRPHQSCSAVRACGEERDELPFRDIRLLQNASTRRARLAFGRYSCPNWSASQPGSRATPLDPFSSSDPIEDRHVQIENDNIRTHRGDGRQALPAIASLDNVELSR